MTRLSESIKATRPSAHKVPDVVMHRALTRSVFDPDTGCFISTYSVGSHGYAQIGWSVPNIAGRKKGNAGTTAHRAAWAAVNGPIPDGMTIDHTCKNRRCVNFAHLRMLPNYENARRTFGRDWTLGQCINGHPNSELRKNGTKTSCGICMADWQRRHRLKKGLQK